MTAPSAVAVAGIFIWLGMVLGISFIETPLRFRAPGVTSAKGSCAMPLSQVQILPTLAELCGVPVTSAIDGRSFMAQLRQPADVRDNPVFAEYALRSPRASRRDLTLPWTRSRTCASRWTRRAPCSSPRRSRAPTWNAPSTSEST